MLHAKQIRAARAMLGWGQRKMADRCGLSMSTIRNLEEGRVEGRSPTYRMIQRVFEENGVEFTEMEGLRSRPRGLTVYEGPDAQERFFEHVSKIVGELGGEVLAICSRVAMLWECLGVTASEPVGAAAPDSLAVKCLVLDSEEGPTGGGTVQFRAVPRLQAWPTPYFIYGDRVCFSVWDVGASVRFIVIQSASQASEWRDHFLKLWDAAPLLKQRTVERIARRQQ